MELNTSKLEAVFHRAIREPASTNTAFECITRMLATAEVDVGHLRIVDVSDNSGSTPASRALRRADDIISKQRLEIQKLREELESLKSKRTMSQIPFIGSVSTRRGISNGKTQVFVLKAIVEAGRSGMTRAEIMATDPANRLGISRRLSEMVKNSSIFMAGKYYVAAQFKEFHPDAWAIAEEARNVRIMDEAGTVEFAVFEKAARFALHRTKGKWQTYYEEQTGTAHGTFQRWRVDNRVPIGELAKCLDLTPVVPVRPIRWKQNPEMGRSLLELYNSPAPRGIAHYAFIAREMSKRYPDEFFNVNVIAGAVTSHMPKNERNRNKAKA